MPKILDDHGLLDLARLGFLAPVFVAAVCLRCFFLVFERANLYFPTRTLEAAPRRTAG